MAFENDNDLPRRLGLSLGPIRVRVKIKSKRFLSVNESEIQMHPNGGDFLVYFFFQNFHGHLVWSLKKRLHTNFEHRQFFQFSENHFDKMAINFFWNSNFLVFYRSQIWDLPLAIFPKLWLARCLPDSFISKGHHSQLELRISRLWKSGLGKLVGHFWPKSTNLAISHLNTPPFSCWSVLF